MAVALNMEEQALQFQEHLDRAANEVFSTMLGVSCLPAEAERSEEAISAVIGLAGALSGSIVLHCSTRAAMSLTERMTGMAPEAVDAMVRDAIGEICNMVAGAWKGLSPDLISGCLLSTPTVVEGANQKLFSQRASMRVERSYRFDDQGFTLTLFCEL